MLRDSGWASARLIKRRMFVRRSVEEEKDLLVDEGIEDRAFIRSWFIEEYVGGGGGGRLNWSAGLSNRLARRFSDETENKCEWNTCGKEPKSNIPEDVGLALRNEDKIFGVLRVGRIASGCVRTGLTPWVGARLFLAALRIWATCGDIVSTGGVVALGTGVRVSTDGGSADGFWEVFYTRKIQRVNYCDTKIGLWSQPGVSSIVLSYSSSRYWRSLSHFFLDSTRLRATRIFTVPFSQG